MDDLASRLPEVADFLEHIIKEDKEVVSVLYRLRHTDKRTSLEIARSTLTALQRVVHKGQNLTPTQLFVALKAFGTILVKTNTLQPVICGVVQRSLRTLRERHANLASQQPPSESSPRTTGHGGIPGTKPSALGKRPSMTYYFDTSHETHLLSSRELSASVFDALGDMLAEILEVPTPPDTAVHDLFLPHSNIMVHGYSFAVLQVLKQIDRRCRHANYYVVCGDHENGSDEMVKELSKHTHGTVLEINLATVHAVMPHMHGVFIGSVAVLSSGGATCVSGAYLLCISANEYSKPVFCVSPLYKLIYHPLTDNDVRNDLISPYRVR